MNNVMELNTNGNKINNDLAVIFQGMNQTNLTISKNLELLTVQTLANERMIKTLASQIDEVKTQTENNTNDIIAIKENDRITSGQNGMIKKTAYKRICDFLEPGTITWSKYSKMYFQDLYRYLRGNCYLQTPNSETRKKIMIM